MTVGYDRFILLWDLREPRRPIESYKTERSGSMAIGHNMMVVIDGDNHRANIYELNEIGRRNNPLFVSFEA